MAGVYLFYYELLNNSGAAGFSIFYKTLQFNRTVDLNGTGIDLTIRSWF
jgi:hypothetical protein